MNAVADVNVAFALLVENHAHHATAWEWWEDRADTSVGLCLPVRLGILRLLTNARAMEGSPLTPGEAIKAWDALKADPRTFPLPLPERAHEAAFRRFVTGRQPSPNLWTDAWLAAIAASLGIGLTSFDADFHAFGLAAFEHLKAGIPDEHQQT